MKYSRRAFLTTTAGLAAAQVAQDSIPPAPGPSGRLWDPSRAGRPMDPTRPQDNDAAIQALEKQLKCTCGCGLDIYTCRTTDFNCTFSPDLHRQVVASWEAGQSAQQIIDAFVEQHGIAILMAPPKRGFNLAGYLVPGAVILAAAAVLLVVMRRWTRGLPAAATASQTAMPGPAGASPQELERLRQELERFPG